MPKMFDQWCARSPHYSDSHREWADTVKRFVAREIEPHIDAWERAGELPRELHRKAAEVGIMGLGFPEEYGGITEGIDRFHGLITGAELAHAGAGGLLASLMIHGVALPPVIAAGSPELKQRIVPAVLAGERIIALGVTEPSGGSDVAALRTRAEKKGDRYIINGSKTYITSGMRADQYAPFLEVVETPQFSGDVLYAIACDPDNKRLSGQTLVGAEIALEYGLKDRNGKQPPTYREMLGEPRKQHPARVY